MFGIIRVLNVVTNQRGDDEPLKLRWRCRHLIGLKDRLHHGIILGRARSWLPCTSDAAARIPHVSRRILLIGLGRSLMTVLQA